VSKQARGANVGGFLGLSSSNISNEQPEKLVMKGPGGKGSAEVAVTLLNRKSVQEESPSTKANEENQGQGRGQEKQKGGLKGFFSAMQNASTNVSHMFSPMAASKNRNARTTHHIRCCLMNVSLPWQSLCHDILKSSRIQ